MLKILEDRLLPRRKGKKVLPPKPEDLPDREVISTEENLGDEELGVPHQEASYVVVSTQEYDDDELSYC
jgi:hypothetical protein